MSNDNQADGFKESPGNLCPHCGDMMPEDGSPCPACRHVSPVDPHLSTLTACEQCGSLTAEKWNIPYSGTQVCSECWLEVGEIVSHGKPISPKASEPPGPDVRHNHGSGLTDSTMDLKASVEARRPGRFRSNRFPIGDANMEHGVTGPSPFRKDHNSTCLMCGTIWYDRVMQKCQKCGGLCIDRSSDDLTLLERKVRGGPRDTRSSL